MGKVISISNHKGGCGKTTTSASLGKALSLKEKRVLLVDLDSQRNLTGILLGRNKTPERTIFESLIGEKVLPIINISDNLDLVPSSLDLVGIDRALAMIMGDNIEELLALRGLLDPIRGEYDYIIIDCPPSLGLLTRNALIASDGVIVPLTAEALPANGLVNLMDAIKAVKSGLNPKLSLYGILLTRYNRRRLNRIVEEGLREVYKDWVFQTKIRENVDLMESPLYGKTIFDYSPDSIGARDYISLADEFIQLEKDNRL